MSIEKLSPGPAITASKLLEEAEQYYNEGGIIPKSLRKEYYVALYDTNNKLMGRFIGQYMGIMENELTRSKFQALVLKTDEIIDFKNYIDEENMVTTLLFTNIRNAGKIDTGIQAFKPIDYEEGDFNNGVEENFYRERLILKKNIGVEFPLVFAQKHMKFYDYKTGKQTIYNTGMADVVSSIISAKTGQNLRGIVDPKILNGGKTKRYFRKKRKCLTRKCLTRKYKRKGVKN